METATYCGPKRLDFYRRNENGCDSFILLGTDRILKHVEVSKTIRCFQFKFTHMFLNPAHVILGLNVFKDFCPGDFKTRLMRSIRHYLRILISLIL